MRAVVAYAARTARRLSWQLEGIVPQDLLEELLGAVDSVWMTCCTDDAYVRRLVGGVQRIVTAYSTAPAGMKSLSKFRILFSLVHATFAAMDAIQAAAAPARASHRMKRLARAAHRAVRPIHALTNSALRAALSAAREDYEILLKRYGEHEEVTVGDAVDCFSPRYEQ